MTNQVETNVVKAQWEAEDITWGTLPYHGRVLGVITKAYDYETTELGNPPAGFQWLSLIHI